MTHPDDIKGWACCKCGGPATHFYGAVTLCCQCHGGEIVSKEEALRDNPPPWEWNNKIK